MPDHTPAETLTAAAKRLTDAVKRFEAVFITGPEATALADWLKSAASDAEQIGPDPFALAVAHALLGEVTE